MSYAVRNDKRGFRAVGSPEDIGPDEYFSQEMPDLPAFVDSSSVDVEMKTRMESGFAHDGKMFRSSTEDRASITENANLASMAIMNNAGKDVLDWLVDGEEFTWPDANNQPVKLTAQGMVDLARAATVHRNGLNLAARKIKAMTPIPANFKDDSFWS